MTGWGKVGRHAGLVAGVALLAQTLLFLVDTLGFIDDDPTYRATAAGEEQDLANYFLALFEHQHALVWNIAIRDVLGPIGFVAVGILALALTRVLGRDRPDVVLSAVALQVGAAVAALADLTYLSTVGTWRLTGFSATPPADIISAGRAYEQIDNLSTYLQLAGYSVLAIGILMLARLCRRDPEMPNGLATVATIEAVAVIGLVTASVTQSWTIFDVLAIVSGVALAPAVLVWTGVAVHRLSSPGSTDSPVGLPT